MSLDIKTFRPRKWIPVHIYQCQSCGDTVLHSQVADAHNDVTSKCDGNLIAGGDFKIQLEYTSPKELQALKYTNDDGTEMLKTGELAMSKLVDWSGLNSGGKDLAFNEKNVSAILDAIPGLMELVWVLSATRSLFGLPDIENFAKNLNGQSNGKTSTKMEVSQPTAQRA